MAKNSTNVSSFKVIQGGKAEVVKSTKALTHKDIKEFLAKFAEAILVDQERVNKLPRKNFHPLYDTACGRGIAKTMLALLLNYP
jgi:hypothetical protein